MNFWWISKCGQDFLKIRKRMERGRLQLGSFALLVAHGRGSRVGHMPEWAGLACWPAHPWGEKGVEGPTLGLLVLLTAQEERRPKT